MHAAGATAPQQNFVVTGIVSPQAAGAVCLDWLHSMARWQGLALAPAGRWKPRFFALLAGAAAGLMDAQLQKWLHDEEHREVTAPDVVCSGRGPGCTMPIFP